LGNRLKEILENTVLKNMATTEEEKEKLMENLTNKSTPKRPINYKYLFASFGAILISLVFITSQITNPSQGVIVDNDTVPEINFIKDVPSEMIEHLYVYDNMDRGNHDYREQILIIQPLKMEEEISRGDIVFFEDELGEKIARVVGLSGEKIRIRKGQVYIDNKLLDSFYGKSTRLGMKREKYYEKMNQGGIEYDKEVMEQVFNYDLKEVLLSENEYFLISDDWLRGSMNKINIEKIKGKVVGVKE
jgi:hypothetical protein